MQNSLTYFSPLAYFHLDLWSMISPIYHLEAIHRFHSSHILLIYILILISRVSALPAVHKSPQTTPDRVNLVMDKMLDLLQDYINRGHPSCPLLWTRRKWKIFLTEKMEESLRLLAAEFWMDLPPGYSFE